jgi:hypothetical protein
VELAGEGGQGGWQAVSVLHHDVRPLVA